MAMAGWATTLMTIVMAQQTTLTTPMETAQRALPDLKATTTTGYDNDCEREGDASTKYCTQDYNDNNNKEGEGGGEEEGDGNDGAGTISLQEGEEEDKRA